MSGTSGPDSDRNPVERLAEEFLERLRAGRRPSLTEYAERYPEHAEAIRELFPVLVTLECVRPEPQGTQPAVKPVESFGASIPERFGDYRIIREIGRGGMGLVYEAEQESLGRRVALKVLPLHASMAGTAVERFRREAQAAARLHHTNIVPVFDVGQEGPTCYYAMQYIHGAPLDLLINRLRQLQTNPDGDPDETPAISPPAVSLQDLTVSLLTGKFGADWPRPSSEVVAPDRTAPARPSRNWPSAVTRRLAWASASTEGAGDAVGEKRIRLVLDSASLPDTQSRPYFESVARLGFQVADALAYAHAKGVIHRDIKPSNLLLDSSGVAWVTDFGMVKVDGESITLTGDILGTLRYMAPERFQGRCDARADVYALGLTLYELLTLKPVFEAPDRLSLMEMIATKAPAPPRQFNRRIPRDLETIVTKAIEKDPDRRYASAEAMSEDLQRFLSDRPILARRVGMIERAMRWSRRNPAVSALATALATLLLAIAGVSTIAAYRYQLIADRERAASTRARAAEQQARGNQAQAEANELRAAQRAEELRRQDYINRVNLAYHESRFDNAARAKELLDGCPPDLCGWEWNFVHHQITVALRSWTEEGHSVNSVAFHPGGERVAIGTGNFVNRPGPPGELLVRNIDTQEIEFACRDLADGVNIVAYSPDGTLLAAGHGTQFRVWDAASGEELFAHRAAQGVIALQFSPDSRSLAVGIGTLNTSEVGSATVYDARTGEPLGAAIPGRAGGVWSLAFHPSGEQLALASEGVVELWDLTSRTRIRQLHGETGFLYAVAWHPSGNYVAAGGLNRTIRLWDTSTGELVRSYSGHTGIIRTLAFGPDGRLVSAGEDKSIRLWELGSEREQTVFHGHMHFVNSVSFSNDGYVLVSGGLDRAVKLWFTAADHQLAYDGHLRQGHVRSVAFSPQGDAVASGAFYFSGEEDRLHVWHPVTGRLLVPFPSNIGDVVSLTFDRDGRRIVSGHPDGTIRIWEARTGQMLARFEAHIGAVWDVKFTRDGSQLASGGQDGAVNLWNPETGELIRSIFAHLDSVRSIEFSPNDRLIASAGSDGSVKLWEASSGRWLQSFVGHEGTAWGVAFSPDGLHLAASGGVDHRAGDVCVWNVETGEVVHRLRSHTDVVFDVAFSPDGGRIATASDDRTIKLWDAQTGDEMFTLRGHSGGVTCIAFSPDGRKLVSGSVDRLALVWSVDEPSEEERYERQAARDWTAAMQHLNAGRWEDAIETFKLVAKHGGPDPRARAYEVLATLQRDPDLPQAEAKRIVAETAESIDDAALLVRWADELARRGRSDMALIAAQRALEVEPQQAEARRTKMRLELTLENGNPFDASDEQLARGDLLDAPADRSGSESPWFETGWWIDRVSVNADGDVAPSDETSAPVAVVSDHPQDGGELATTRPWIPVVAEGDGFVNLRGLCDGLEAVRAVQRIYSPARRTVALRLRSPRPMTVKLNESVVYEREGNEARATNQTIPATLETGWNTLLVKLDGRPGRRDAYRSDGMHVELSGRPYEVARAHLSVRDLDAVLQVWERAGESDRQQWQLLAAAGEAHARRGRWHEAVAIYQRLIERQPVRNRNWTMLAPLLLMTGNEGAYHEHRRAMLDHFSESKLPITLERTAKACLLLPDDGRQLADAVELARRAAQLGAHHPFVAYFHLADGIGRYRSGAYDEACRLLETARRVDGDRDPYLAVTALCFQAMAHQRQGRVEDARPLLEQALAMTAERLPAVESGDLGPAWSDWLVCELARREAGQLISLP